MQYSDIRLIAIIIGPAMYALYFWSVGYHRTGHPNIVDAIIIGLSSAALATSFAYGYDLVSYKLFDIWGFNTGVTKIPTLPPDLGSIGTIAVAGVSIAVIHDVMKTKGPPDSDVGDDK